MKNDEHVEKQRLATGFPQQLAEDVTRYIATKAPDFHLGEVNLSNSSIHGHILSDEALHQFRLELDKGNEWLAYNSFSYTLEKYDLYFFDSQEEANDFAESNISDFDNYRVTNFRRLAEAVAENIEDEKMSFIQNTNTMNQKNFDYLKDQIKFTGFGDSLENDLREKVQKQAPEFQLYHNTKFGNDVATATLHFKKSDQSDMYFFNKYDLTLKPENSSNIMKQTFYIGKANNITLKEGYNLMSGRAVNKDLTSKEGQVYNAWLQMDFKETDKNGNFPLKQFHQNYGFDLGKELAKHPIKELAGEQDKARLMESLQKGNRQAVTFVKEGAEQRLYIEANPRFKSLNVYDNSMQRVHSQSQKQKSSPEQSVKQEAKNESRKQGRDDGEGFAEPKQKRSRKKGQSIS